MRVTLHLLPSRKETKSVVLKSGATAEDAIRALGLLPDGWIPIRNNAPIPLDEPLEDGDSLKLVSVVSGG